MKLHGLRIELGEVEAAMLSTSGVIEAAAMVKDDRLVGYYSPTTLASRHSYRLYSDGLCSYGPYSYGLYSYGLFSYGLYRYDLHSLPI